MRVLSRLTASMSVRTPFRCLDVRWRSEQRRYDFRHDERYRSLGRRRRHRCRNALRQRHECGRREYQRERNRLDEQRLYRALDISASFASDNVVNSGTISAQASSARSYASAAGLTVFVSTFLGGITNSGTIAASANTTHNGACATGVFLNSTLMTGNFSNAGTITATAIGSGIAAFATGVSINVEALIGGIVNSGTIIATSTGNYAHATALTQYNYNSAHGIYIVSTIVTGGFSNTGILSGNATATSGTASAMGAQLGVYSFNGSVNFDNGFTNAGLISARAVGTGNAYAHATAASIYAYGGASAALSDGITNSGSIIATGTATGTGGVEVKRPERRGLELRI